MGGNNTIAKRRNQRVIFTLIKTATEINEVKKGQKKRNHTHHNVWMQNLHLLNHWQSERPSQIISILLILPFIFRNNAQA